MKISHCILTHYNIIIPIPSVKIFLKKLCTRPDGITTHIARPIPIHVISSRVTFFSLFHFALGPRHLHAMFYAHIYTPRDEQQALSYMRVTYIYMYIYKWRGRFLRAQRLAKVTYVVYATLPRRSRRDNLRENWTFRNKPSAFFLSGARGCSKKSRSCARKRACCTSAVVVLRTM